MNNISRFVLSLTCMTSLYAAETASTPAPAPASVPETAKEEAPFPITVGATLDLYSAYIWHGCILNDEPVWQPDFAISYSMGDYGTVSADAWMNFDATGNNRATHAGGINEIDYTIQYAVNIGDVSLGVGHVWYTFPSVSSADYYPSTREIFVSAAYNNSIVTPFAKAYYDYARADGAYVTIGLRREHSITDQLLIGAELAFGGATHPYTQYYFGADGNYWFTDAAATLYTKYSLTDNIFIGAKLGWVSVMDNELKGVYHEDNLLWGGINLGVSL